MTTRQIVGRSAVALAVVTTGLSVGAAVDCPSSVPCREVTCWIDRIDEEFFDVWMLESGYKLAWDDIFTPYASEGVFRQNCNIRVGVYRAASWTPFCNPGQNRYEEATNCTMQEPTDYWEWCHQWCE